MLKFLWNYPAAFTNFVSFLRVVVFLYMFLSISTKLLCIHLWDQRLLKLYILIIFQMNPDFIILSQWHYCMKFMLLFLDQNSKSILLLFLQITQFWFNSNLSLNDPLTLTKRIILELSFKVVITTFLIHLSIF